MDGFVALIEIYVAHMQMMSAEKKICRVRKHHAHQCSLADCTDSPRPFRGWYAINVQGKLIEIDAYEQKQWKE